MADTPDRDPLVAVALAALDDHCHRAVDAPCRCHRPGDLAMLGVFCVHDLATLLRQQRAAFARELGEALNYIYRGDDGMNTYAHGIITAMDYLKRRADEEEHRG